MGKGAGSPLTADFGVPGGDDNLLQCICLLFYAENCRDRLIEINRYDQNFETDAANHQRIMHKVGVDFKKTIRISKRTTAFLCEPDRGTGYSSSIRRGHHLAS